MGNYKEELLQKLRSNTREQYDMPADEVDRKSVGRERVC